MANPPFPLLVLPSGVAASSRARSFGGGSSRAPKKPRLIELIGPKFAALDGVVEAKRMQLSATPEGVAPELVVVFETNASASDFVTALRETPELAWLVELDREDVLPDEDFYDPDDREQTLNARVFLVMANHTAIAQLLSLWATWKASTPARLPHGHKHWAKAFKCLRDVRTWGPKDRVLETGLDQDWQERRALGQQVAPVEIELWFRGVALRTAAAARVRRDVEAAGGTVFAEKAIPEIEYHALAAELPARAVEALLRNDGVALIRSDDVHLIRPVPQQPVLRGEPERGESIPGAPPTTTSGAPLVGLLDGLPQQNHALLRGFLRVDDPDGWEPSYPVETRRHGTAMASLLLHGDRSTAQPPPTRPIYVRPVLRPRMDLAERGEEAPPRELFVDVIRRAVVRMLGSDRTPGVASSVKIINLSIGDRYQPYLGRMSPLARLLDWLAWDYGVLFIVSAGNHDDVDLTLAETDDPLEVRALHALQRDHRLRRLLSPAESINALTVGAANMDHAGSWTPRNPDEVDLLETPELPSLVSALGRGHRRAVKPDVLAAGGRAIFARQIANPASHRVSYNRMRFPPGQRVAEPRRIGGVDGEIYTFGTSNAAAIASRAAGLLLEAILDLKATPDGAPLIDVPDALLAKALLVHTASWHPNARAVLERALSNAQNQSRLRDHLCAFVGYGLVREGRGVECLQTRATLIGGGSVPLGAAVEHRVPIPTGLNAYTGARSWIATLAWFSPIRVRDRRYRHASLDVTQQPSVSSLAVGANEADGNAAKRGTVQHVVMRGDRSAIAVGRSSEVVLNVTAASEIDPADNTPIPYALAVTLEVEESSSVRIYDQIRERLRTRVAVRGRP